MTSTLTKKLPRRITLPLLLVILLAGFLLRVWNINFDQGIGSHPDERSTACFYATTIGLPASWDEFWDPQQSPLNPLWDQNQQRSRSFTYGHLPLYLGVAAGHVLHWASPSARAVGLPDATVALMERADRACDAIAVAGRLVIALFDTLTILLLYLLGARILGRGGGLLAAAFYAFTAQAIQLSHFFAMDPASTTFTVLTVLGGVYMALDGRLRWAMLTGVGVGLAIASKFSALPLLAVPVVAAFLSVWRAYELNAKSGDRVDGRAGFRAVVSVLIAWIGAFLVFFVTSPYAILDWGAFSRAVLVEQGMMVRGVADWPFTRQYRNTLPYVYFIQQQLQWGLGLALGLVAAVGTLYALFIALRSLIWLVANGVAAYAGRSARRWLDDAALANLVIWSWVLPYFAVTGAFLAKFNRYMSPLLPFVLLWGAWVIVVLWRAGARPSPATVVAPVDPDDSADVPGEISDDTSPARAHKWRAVARPLAVILAAVGLLGGVLWSLAYVNGVYNREHTWITASRWIYANVAPGSTLLWELWDDPLPKAIPGEPGMDMGSHQLANIDWSPYEEDTADKYALMKEKLREADYVVYSSKRIYDSVDELPQRYPMTNLYYAAMRDGRLGFELAAEFTSPPRLFGLAFDDRTADESYSLYDHPQVSVYQKVRDLNDAEFDAIFDSAWTRAVPGYRGADSPLSPFLNFIGLGNEPGSESAGLINRLIGLFTAAPVAASPVTGPRQSLMFDEPITTLAVVDNYRWNTWASENTLLAIFWWWAVLSVIGWLVWPMGFLVFRPMRDRGFFLSRTLGWLLGGWVLWILINLGLLQNLVIHAWLSVLLLAVPGIVFAVRLRTELTTYVRAQWRTMLAGEVVFAVAYLFFIGVRMLNPDLWQPWFGGEKQMEFAFVNGILRSPTFPPVDPHFSGGFINYYYFGLYLVAYLIKLTGIYAEVAFNLTIATLFALTVVNTFAVAYSAIKGHAPLSAKPPLLTWKTGIGSALLAPLFVTIIGNLDGFAQVVRSLAMISPTPFQSALPGLKPLVDGLAGFQKVATEQVQLPVYDFWAPSRVVLPTINEFPYWSFLWADLHPHIIGIPIAAMFLALTLVLIENANTDWRRRWRYGLGLLGVFALFLGGMASINLWELPTYLGLGLLAFVVSQFRGRGRINWLLTLGVGIVYVAGAYLLFLPFFRSYVNVGASGVGLLREPDPPEQWLLVWGFLGFVVLSWILFASTRPARPLNQGSGYPSAKPAGIERATSLLLRQFDRLPQAIFLHQRLVAKPRFFYLILLVLIPLTALLALVAVFLGWVVLAICLLPLGLAIAILWRRGEAADSGSLFAGMLATSGLALLAGTQILYLRDFLDGSEYYRMNTLFKFFNQVWLLWGMAAAVAVPRLLDEFAVPVGEERKPSGFVRSVRIAWSGLFAVLLVASLAFPVLGTPARLDQRMPGWRPAFGTLNGLDFMREGSYAWPDFGNVFELRYEWEAIQWLLEHVEGNATIVESSEVDYYRAWGTRIASNTGLSGLKGMHEQEQRYPEVVGYRDGLQREFWTSPDIPRTVQIIDELNVDMVYVGQLERFLHPEGVLKIEAMAEQGDLVAIYQNDRVTIYTVPGRLQQMADGSYRPAQG